MKSILEYMTNQFISRKCGFVALSVTVKFKS